MESPVRRLIILLCPFIYLCSCGSVSPTRDQFTILISDRQRDSAFQLQVNSKSDKLLCIPFGEWPYMPSDEKFPQPAGSMHFMQYYVFVQSHGNRYHTKKRNHGTFTFLDENPLGFYTVIPAGDRIISYIPQSEFENHKAFAGDAQKKLIYSPNVEICEYQN